MKLAELKRNLIEFYQVCERMKCSKMKQVAENFDIDKRRCLKAYHIGAKLSLKRICL